MSLLGRALGLENAELSARVLRLEEELRERDAALARVQAAGALQARTQLAEARARALALRETLLETDRELQALRARTSEDRARREAAELAVETLRARCAQAEARAVRAAAGLEAHRRGELLLATALRDTVMDLLPTQDRLYPELALCLDPGPPPPGPGEGPPGEGAGEPGGDPGGGAASEPWPEPVQTRARLAGNLYHGCRRRIDALALVHAPSPSAERRGREEQRERDQLREEVARLRAELEAARAAHRSLQESGRATIARIKELQAMQLGIQEEKLRASTERCAELEGRLSALERERRELQRFLAARAAAAEAPSGAWGEEVGEGVYSAPGGPPRAPESAEPGALPDPAESPEPPEAPGPALQDSAPEVEIPGRLTGPAPGPGVEGPASPAPGEHSAAPGPDSADTASAAIPSTSSTLITTPAPPPAAPPSPPPAADESTDIDLQALHGDALRTARELGPLVSSRSAEMFRLAASGKLSDSALDEQIRLLRAQ